MTTRPVRGPPNAHCTSSAKAGTLPCASVLRPTGSRLVNVCEHRLCRSKAVLIGAKRFGVEQGPDRIRNPLPRPILGGLKHNETICQFERVVLVMHVFWPLHCFEYRSGRGEFRSLQKDAERPRTRPGRARPKHVQDCFLVDLAPTRSGRSFIDDLIQLFGSLRAGLHSPNSFVGVRGAGDALPDRVRRVS